ncbi:MAG: tetratricopeptide repeat protein [Promethearchaeota archaeon]
MMFSKMGRKGGERCALCGFPVIDLPHHKVISTCGGCMRAFVVTPQGRILIEDYFDPDKILHFEDAEGFSAAYHQALANDQGNQRTSNSMSQFGFAMSFHGTYEPWEKVMLDAIKIGNNEEAMFAAMHALHDYGIAHSFWGLTTQVLIHIGLLELAEKGLSILNRLEDIPKGLIVKLTSYLAVRKREIAEMEKSPGIRNRNVFALNILGYFSLQLGNLVRAEKRFRQALSIDDKSAEAWYSIATIELLNHQYESALKNITKSLALDNKSMRSAPSWHVGYKIYLKLKNLPKAFEFLSRAIELTPFRTDYQEELIALQEQLKNPPQKDTQGEQEKRTSSYDDIPQEEIPPLRKTPKNIPSSFSAPSDPTKNIPLHDELLIKAAEGLKNLENQLGFIRNRNVPKNPLTVTPEIHAMFNQPSRGSARERPTPIGIFGVSDRGIKLITEHLGNSPMPVSAITGLDPALVQRAQKTLDPLIRTLPYQSRPRFYPDFRQFLFDRSYQMLFLVLPPGIDQQIAQICMQAGKAPMIITAHNDPRTPLRPSSFSRRNSSRSYRYPPPPQRSAPRRRKYTDPSRKFLPDMGKFRNAQHLFETKQYDQALVQFTAIIKESPEEFLANCYLGLAHMKLANHSEAAEFFKSFLQNAQNQQVFQKYALHKGLSESDFNPYLFMANYNLAIIELQNQSFTAARSYLSQGSRYRKDSASLWLGFGISNYFLSELSKAEKNFQYVLTHYAKSPEAIQAQSLLNRIHGQLNAEGGTIHLDTNHRIIVQFED